MYSKSLCSSHAPEYGKHVLQEKRTAFIPLNALRLIVAGFAINGFAATSDLLLSASFNGSPDAEYAAGSPSAKHHDNLTLVPGGRSGDALSIAPLEWLRCTTDQNISFDEGTLSVWIKPNFELSSVNEGFSRDVQYIAASRIRSGAQFTLYLVPKQSVVVAEIAADRNTSVRFGIPVQWSGTDAWHHLILSWKKPGRFQLTVDGKTVSQTKDGALPDLSSSFMYDLFLGSNAKQITVGPYGELGHFDGLIDDLRIYSTFNRTPDELPPPVIEPPQAPAPVHHDPRWIGKNSERLNVYLTETKREWQQVPVSVPVDFSQAYAQLDGAGRRAFIDSIRVVQTDPVTGEPLVCDAAQEGDNRLFVPFQVTDNLYWEPEGAVRFSHLGKLPACYSIYFDAAAPYAEAFPKEFPMVGNGDRLHVGKKGETGLLAGTIRGYFRFWDADGDGDLDLWFSQGDMKQQCDEFLSGHCYYENIGTPQQPLFAPQQLIVRDNPPMGELSRTSAPQLIDCDGDGQLDLFVFGRSLRAWAPFSMEQGRPVLGEWSPVDFKGKIPSGERGRLFDFDGNGSLDLLYAERVYLNSSETGLAFSSDAFSELGKGAETGDPDVKLTIEGGWDFPVDFDSDGDIDILSEGFNTKVYLHENLGGNAFAPSRRIETHAGHEIMIPGVFPAPCMADIDGDGDQDFLWSNDQALIGWNENIAFEGSEPVLLRQTKFLQQLNPFVDPGALVIPVMTDWDDDGDLDIICGASDEYVYYYENRGTAKRPVFDGPTRIDADHAPICIRAGKYGSIQGEAENDWAYLNPEVADWNGDGLKDLILGGVQGIHFLYLNVGAPGRPRLTDAGTIEVNWKEGPSVPEWLRFKPSGSELIGMQRTRPAAVDWNGDGVMDLVTLDHENKLAFFQGLEREGKVIVEEGRNIFTFERAHAQSLYINRPEQELKWVGAKSYYHFTGRTVNNIVDWDHDGDFDLVWDNVNGRLYENTGSNGQPHFVDRGDLVPDRIVRHNTGPDVVDVDGDGWEDLICGAETGRIFYFHRAYIECDVPRVIKLRGAQARGRFY